MIATQETKQKVISWDIGTAYELFLSLHVLHLPEYYGVRASWAAGIRSRIPAADRKFLEETQPFLGFPVGWVHQLPGPKDAISALWAIKQIPPAERIFRVFECDLACEEMPVYKILREVSNRRSWIKADMEAIKKIYLNENPATHPFMSKEEAIVKFLDWWARPEEYGEAFLKALQAYHQAFFEAEEKRVAPVLQAGLEIAKEKARHLSAKELVADLSQGVHFDEVVEKEVSELIVVPAYWTTPLVALEKISEGKYLFLFGARPANMSAIPGELVPDSLVRTLKALADPTRLKIMRYLTQEEITPSELARRLNLRAPTVTHHLSELRLSGLVNVTIRGQEKLYTSRLQSLDTACQNLREFLEKGQVS